MWNLVIQLQGAVGALSHCSSSSVTQTIHRRREVNHKGALELAYNSTHKRARAPEPVSGMQIRCEQERIHRSSAVSSHGSSRTTTALTGAWAPSARIEVGSESDTGRVRERQRGLTPPACRYPLPNGIPLNITLYH